MNSGVSISQLVQSLHAVDLETVAVNYFHLRGNFGQIFKNATAISELAQAMADPRGNSPESHQARMAIKHASNVKLCLGEIMGRNLTEKQAQRLLGRMRKDYEKMVRSMTILGEKRLPGLGIAIPQLL